MTKDKKEKNKGGRKPKPIDEKLVESLASIHCTMKEIGTIVGCSVDTLERRFADIIRKGQEDGRSSLRRLQWLSASKGNTQMQIWLGKQWLGQKDKQPDEVAQVNYNVFTNEIPK